MLRETKVTADTIEEAKQKACQELGIDMEKAHFEVLRQPEKKLLGLFGGSPAEVRAFYEVTPLECAKEYLEEILKYMDIGDITVTAEEDENGAVITLDGENVSYIIGHRGETLDAIQYLTGLVANHVDQSYYRISINIGNYREKREKTLEILGRKLAFKAIKTGQKTALEPMNPYERRIIHTAVQNHFYLFQFSRYIRLCLCYRECYRSGFCYAECRFHIIFYQLGQFVHFYLLMYNSVQFS